MSLSYFPPGVIHLQASPKDGSPQERIIKLTNHGQHTVVYMVLNNSKTDTTSFVVPGAGKVDPGRSAEAKIVLQKNAVVTDTNQQFMFMSSAVQPDYADRPPMDLWAKKSHLEGEIHTHVIKVRCDSTAGDIEDRSGRLVTSPSHHVCFNNAGNSVKLSLTNKAPDPIVFEVLVTDSTIVSARPNTGMIGSGWTTKVDLSCARWERLSQISRSEQEPLLKLRVVFAVLPRDKILRRDDNKAIRSYIAMQSSGLQYKTLTLGPELAKPAVAHIEGPSEDEDEEEEVFVLCPEKIKREDSGDEATLVNFDAQRPRRGLMHRVTAHFSRLCACQS